MSFEVTLKNDLNFVRLRSWKRRGDKCREKDVSKDRGGERKRVGGMSEGVSLSGPQIIGRAVGELEVGR